MVEATGRQTGLAEAILALAHGPDAPLTYREVAARVYGSEEPNRAERHAVARAARRLAGKGEVALFTVDVPERTRTRAARDYFGRRYEACRGARCWPCQEGMRKPKVWRSKEGQERFAEIMRRERDPKDAEREIALAAKYGVHVSTGECYVPEHEERAGGPPEKAVGPPCRSKGRRR